MGGFDDVYADDFEVLWALGEDDLDAIVICSEQGGV